MHSYQHNIKTFNSATRHLTRVERALYRDLIELYYDTESPLTSDMERLCRMVIAATDEEKAALIYVLAEFFVLTGTVYTHDYCDEQIAKYKCALTAKSAAGIASANAKKQRADARKADRSTQSQQNSTPVQQMSNEIQLTSNHKPVTNIKDKDTAPAKAVAVLKPKKSDGHELLNSIPDLHPQVAADYITSRKTKKAGVLTETSLAMINAQAKEAGLTLAQAITFAAGKGWVGFNAKWYAKEIHGDPEQKTFYEKTREAKERDADKRLTGLASCSMLELEALGLARDGVMLGARA